MIKSYRLFTRSTRPSAKLVLDDILETADLFLVREWAEQRRSSTVREIVVFVDGRRHLTIREDL